jgi:hypothetical protein
MLAMALLLILLGIMLVHAAITGKSIGSLLRGSGNIDTKAEPTLSTEKTTPKRETES